MFKIRVKVGFFLPKLKEVFLSLFFFFLLCFPKGGIKLYGLPVTFGFLFLFSIGFLGVLRKEIIFSKNHLLIFLAFFPFQIISLITILINGQGDVGYTASYLINFFVVPILFLLVFPQYVDEAFEEKLLLWVKRGVFFIGLYGVFLFFYKIIIGRFFEIPFLTVNYHDAYDLENQKCIDRGGFFKLISTYNNGNLYGVCVLMLLPLYSFLEDSFLKKVIVKTSLFLTLSRSIWMGLFLYEVLMIFVSNKSLMKKGFFLIMNMSFFGICLFLLTHFFPISWDFIFDRFLGNRIGQFDVLKEIEWFSTKPFQGIYEVIYLGLIRAFGITGLLAFLFAFSFPVFFTFIKNRLGWKEKPYQMYAGVGLFLYLLIAAADGALLLIPVLCFCFFLMFLISLNTVNKKSLI